MSDARPVILTLTQFKPTLSTVHGYLRARSAGSRVLIRNADGDFMPQPPRVGALEIGWTSTRKPHEAYTERYRLLSVT